MRARFINMLNSRQVGNIYENLARRILSNKGYIIIEQNYRVKIGEIDIIAKDGDTLCFVEVKYRKAGSLVSGAFAVDKKKQKKIYNVAKLYMQQNKIDEDTPCRFDVVSVDGDKVELFKNAFP